MSRYRVVRDWTDWVVEVKYDYNDFWMPHTRHATFEEALSYMMGCAGKRAIVAVESEA